MQTLHETHRIGSSSSLTHPTGANASSESSTHSSVAPRLDVMLPTPGLQLFDSSPRDTSLEALVASASSPSASPLAISTSGPLIFAKVKADYVPKNHDELSLEEEDIIRVLSPGAAAGATSDIRPGMLIGTINGLTGWFPAENIRILSEDEAFTEGLSTSGSMSDIAHNMLGRNESTVSNASVTPYDASHDRQDSTTIFAGTNSVVSMESFVTEDGQPFDGKPVAILGAPAGQRQLWVDFMGGLEIVEGLGLSKKDIKRQEVIYEIISTETDYLDDLDIVCEVYIKQLKRNKLIRPKDMAIIFSNIEQLLPVNMELLKSLVKRQENNKVIELVGDLFIRVRVCKYPLFLRELIKATDPDHADSENLIKALMKIETVVTIINEGARQTENVHKMIELQGKFITKVNIVAPSRVMIKNGMLDVRNSHNEVKRREVFLFNDMLIIAKHMGEQYKLINMIPFDAVQINSGGEESSQVEILHNGTTVCSLLFETVPTKETWIAIIQNTVNEWLAHRNRLNAANGTAMKPAVIIGTEKPGQSEPDLSIKDAGAAGSTMGSNSTLHTSPESTADAVPPPIFTPSPIALQMQKVRLTAPSGGVATKPLPPNKSKNASLSSLDALNSSAGAESLGKSAGAPSSPNGSHDKSATAGKTNHVSFDTMSGDKHSTTPSHVAQASSTSTGGNESHLSPKPPPKPSSLHVPSTSATGSTLTAPTQTNGTSASTTSTSTTPIATPTITGTHTRGLSREAVSSANLGRSNTAISKPVKQAKIVDLVRGQGAGAKSFLYNILVVYIGMPETQPIMITQSFDAFFDLHLQLVGHFPEAAGIATGAEVIRTPAGQPVVKRILPELPAQMMFVSEAVARNRIVELQAYLDVSRFVET
eukprot:jgi/Hompol1/5367/HPOL_004431-RA